MSSHVKPSGSAQTPVVSGAKLDVEPKESSRLASLVRRICSLLRRVLNCVTCGLLCKEANQPISNRPSSNRAGANQLDSKNISTPANAIPAQKTRLTEVLEGLNKVAPYEQLKRMQEAVSLLKDRGSFAPGEKHAALEALLQSLLSEQRWDNFIDAERFERIEQSTVRDLFDCITSGKEDDLRKELLERLIDKSISEEGVHKVRPECIVEAVLQSSAPLREDLLANTLIDSFEGSVDFLLLLEKHRGPDLNAFKKRTEVFGELLEGLVDETIEEETAFECASKLSDLGFALDSEELGQTLLSAVEDREYDFCHRFVEFLKERLGQDFASCDSKEKIVEQLKKNVNLEELCGEHLFEWICLLPPFGYKPESPFFKNLSLNLICKESISEDVEKAYLSLLEGFEDKDVVKDLVSPALRRLLDSKPRPTETSASPADQNKQKKHAFCLALIKSFLEKRFLDKVEEATIMRFKEGNPIFPSLKTLLAQNDPDLKDLSDLIEPYRGKRA